MLRGRSKAGHDDAQLVFVHRNVGEAVRAGAIGGGGLLESGYAIRQVYLCAYDYRARRVGHSALNRTAADGLSAGRKNCGRKA